MAEVNIDDLRGGNSRAERERQEEREERRKLENVGGGRSKKMKKSFCRRFVENFIADDVTKDDIRSFIVKDVIVPMIQDAIMDSINGALGMMFGIGIVRSGSSRKTSSGGKIRYGGYFNSGESKKTKSSVRESRREARSGFEIQMKDSKEAALRVMEELEELLDEYPDEGVSVADYYDAFGVSTEHTDNKYGWYDLAGMHIERVPRAFQDEDTGRYLDGFAVVMPRESAL